MDQFKQDLRQHVPGLSNDDVRRIMATAYAEDGMTLLAIADNPGLNLNVTRDGLNYSLQKVYRSPYAPGINNLKDLKDWVKGLIANPFKIRINIVNEFPVWIRHNTWHRTRLSD